MQRADVIGPQLQAALVCLDRFIRERGGGQRRAAKVVRLRIRGVERDGLVEAFQRFGIAVLLFAELTEIENGGEEVRRQRDRSLQQPLRLGVAPGLEDDQREQSQRIDVARVVPQNAADTDARPPSRRPSF